MKEPKRIMRQERIKCKIISFRVTDEEHEKIEIFSRSCGFENVSYFAREVALMPIYTESETTPVELRLNSLRLRMEAAMSMIEKVFTQLCSLPEANLSR